MLSQLMPNLLSIYVPQACSGRITELSLSMGLGSLFVDAFSTCNIVVLSTKDKISVSHVDTMSGDCIAVEKKWIGNDYQAAIFYRERDGQLVCETLKKMYPDINFTTHPVSDDVTGLKTEFAFNQDHPNWPNVLVFKNNQTPNLIHHPMEQKLLTSRQLDQVICLYRPDYPHKFHLIHNGVNWAFVTRDAMTPHCPSIREKGLLATLTPATPSSILFLKIQAILKKHEEDFKGRVYFQLAHDRMASDTVHAAVLYANNYDHQKVFKTDLVDCLAKFKHLLASSDDKALATDLETALTSIDVYGGVQDAIRSNIDNKSKYATEMHSQFKVLEEQYLTGDKYAQRKQAYIDAKKAVREIMVKGTVFFQQEKYSDATSKFYEAMSLATKHMSTDNIYIATLHHYIGRSHFKSGNMDGATSHLIAAHKIYSSFHKEHKKLAEVLEHCKEAGIDPSQATARALKK